MLDKDLWKEQAELVVLEWMYQSMLAIIQIEVFFNIKYLLTGLMSHFGFLDADRHQC